MIIQPRISVCIATHRRNDRLAMLLDDLLTQSRPPDQVVVIDNDANGGAHQVVLRFRGRAAFPVHYEIQPDKNISLTRNRSVAAATGDWLAFIDDDERAPAHWLRGLMQAQHEHHADGVLGPVVPQVPANAADWIQRGRFYDWPRARTGAVVPHNHLRFGNVLLRAAPVQALPVPFDPVFGNTGGEDGDLLVRMARGGMKLVWCDEAIVHEPVEASRLSLDWLLRRALRGGQDYARHSLRGLYRRSNVLSSTVLFVRALAQACAAAFLALVMLPAGRHRSVPWLLKAAANVGKLSVFWGWHYREYA